MARPASHPPARTPPPARAAVTRPLASSRVKDTGLADPAVVAALGEWTAAPGPRTRARALSVLATARVFAAVTARSTAEHVDAGTGLRAESTAEMALVTLAGSTGRAVPVFLDVPGVTGFADGARPVSLTVPQACSAARDDGAVAVVVDPQGAALVLESDELVELAAGRVPVPGARLSARHSTEQLRAPVTAPDPLLMTRLSEALRTEPVHQARLLDGPDGPVLGVVPQAPLDPAALAALAQRLAPRLTAPLDLAVVAPDGPGAVVPLRRRGWLRRGR